MRDKISFDDVVEQYDPSESEEEYSDNEKKLLRKIRDRKEKGVDEQQEVLAFDDDSDDYEDDDQDDYGEEEEDEYDFDEIRKFEHDSDIEDGNDEDHLPDRSAWGEEFNTYYGADFVDGDYESLSAGQEQRALAEEHEAKEMQLRLVQHMQEADYGLDELKKKLEKKTKKKKKLDTTIKRNFSDLSENQKRDLFRKDAPEFEPLAKEFCVTMQECTKVLEPALDLLKQHHKLEHPCGALLKARLQLSMTYCNNISFYLLLKASNTRITEHPVIKRLRQIKELLLELDKKYQTSIKEQVEQLLDMSKRGEEIVFKETETTNDLKPKRRMEDMELLQRDSESDDSQSDDDDDDGEEARTPMARSKRIKLDDNRSDSEDGDNQKEDDAVEENGKTDEPEADDKREITYQMAKNKGLTVRKKKEERNARVKNRNKYRKALIRRKGAIRTVRTEVTRYSGESSGIKAYVKRGIKIK